MTDPVIQEALLEHTKLKPKAGETAIAFTERVVDKVNKMADANPTSWGELTEEVQEWVNINVTAQAQGAGLKLLALEAPADQESGATTGSADEPGTEESSVTAKARPKRKPAAVAKAKSAKGVGRGRTPLHSDGSAAKAKPPVKETKAKRKPAAVAKAKSAKGVGRGRTPLHSDGGVIKVVAKENPHREGTIRFKAFNKVKTGQTVAEAVKAGCPAQQIWSMAHRGLISVSPPR